MRKEAADWAALLFAQARWEGIQLYGVSGYRSYARQKEIYDERIAELKDPEDNLFIAPPGPVNIRADWPSTFHAKASAMI